MFTKDPIRGYVERIEKWDRRLRVGLNVPSEGSELSEDAKAYPQWPLTLFIKQGIRVAVDNLSCMAKLHLHESKEVHLHAFPSLARSTLASASYAVWQLAPDDRRARVDRGLRLVQSNNKNMQDALNSPPEYFGNPDSDAERETKMFYALHDREVPRTFAAYGLKPKGPMKDTQIIESVAEITESLEITRKGELLYLWRRCSGDVHGQAWTMFAPLPPSPYTFVNDLMGVGTALTWYALKLWDQRTAVA